MFLFFNALLFASLAHSSSADRCLITADGALKGTEANHNTELLCRDHKPIELRWLFDNGRISQTLTYGPQKLESRVFDLAGNLTTLVTYEPKPRGRYIRTIRPAGSDRISSKQEISGFDPEAFENPAAFTWKKWSFDRDTQAVAFIEHYRPGETRIIGKEYVDSAGRTTSRISFRYEKNNPKPISFVERGMRGEVLSRHYLYAPFDPRSALEKAGLTNAELERRLRHQQSPDRFLLAVIDSGFDYNHPDLAWKWWNNPNEKADGLDNDGDGWADNFFGWEREKGSPLPEESSTDLSSDIRPDSHGTHVAHIATRDLEGVALIGFAGDYTRATYLDQISAFLKKNQVKVVNISIGLPKDNKDDLGLRDGIKAYERMMRDNPETLFVVAAGNEEMNIDLYKNRQYPGSINLPNVMKVGSLAASRIEREKMSEYKMSYWSNTGLKSVDLLAPGEDISAARIGGGYVTHSGSSMASPYMAREAARLWMMFPRLHAAEVRDIFIRSAYRMSPAPEILSGGFVDFERAVQFAEEL